MTMLNLRVATKEDAEKFFQFFLKLKGKRVLIEDIHLSGLSCRNVKNLVLFVKEEGES